MDFVTGLSLTSAKKDSVWVELCERWILGLKLVSKTENTLRVIRDQLKAASDWQKSYADIKMKDIEFSVGDQVFLRVSPWKKVIRFGCKGKLSLRFINPYRILKRVRPVSYQLELLPKLDQIYDVFHVSMLRLYRSNPSHIVAVNEIELQPDLTFKEEPVQILKHEVKMLRKKTIPLVKVLWQNHGTEEAT
ncbi:uncharacterized protein LOC108488310 [Gossypium arboreum]|uniref:uncharacterized protein LOC108488310 n=1 Tax=Gossypium arboreum TaxID=29729 RepID=UPI00081929FB|nr:uncharacterized protein LOC108488310 [Gossypium arboreum]